MNESPCNPLQPHTQTRTHMQLQSEILYSFSMKQREKKQATYRAQITSDYIHIDAKSQMLKKTFSEVFLCRQRGRDAVRWKPSVTDEKSLASFLSRSLSLSLHLPTFPPSSILSPCLPPCTFMRSHYCCCSLCLWFDLFTLLHCASSSSVFFCFPLPYLASLFFPPLLYSQRGNWNSFLQSICCHTGACIGAIMLCSYSVFSPHFFLLLFCTPLLYNHTYTSTTFTHVQSAGCVTPNALWDWMHAFLCVCNVSVCSQRWHCKVKRTETVLVHNKTWSMAAL